MTASAEVGMSRRERDEPAAAVLPMNGLLHGGALFQTDHFRQIVEHLPTALYTTDAAGRITYFNKAAVALWGRSPQIGEELWCGSWRLFWPDGRPMAHEECPMAVTLKTGYPVLGAQAIAERPDGTRCTIIPFPSLMFDGAGNIVGGVNLLVDAGVWTESEQATQHLAAIVESSEDAIVSKDLDGTIRSWNGAAERMFGYTASEIIGKSILTIIPPERLSEETEIITRIRKGQRIEHYETMRRRKDGSLVDLSLTVSPVQDRNGKVVGASKIARDISERRQLERVKEHLVNEIKHRVKNTLGTVQAMAAQTFRKAPADERNLFVGRIHALADAHDVLTQRNWGNVSLSELVTRLLHPFVDLKQKRMSVEGPNTEISPNRALLLAMVLHEMGTNALKYGALSNDTGTVDVVWDVVQGSAGRRLKLVWTERGGPPVAPPERKGFGSRMIEHAIRGEQGASEFVFDPAGLICRMEMPV
jgi:two-component system, chemotaxis family, CheB/CheR fusion protein